MSSSRASWRCFEPPGNPSTALRTLSNYLHLKISVRCDRTNDAVSRVKGADTTAPTTDLFDFAALLVVVETVRQEGTMGLLATKETNMCRTRSGIPLSAMRAGVTLLLAALFLLSAGRGNAEPFRVKLEWLPLGIHAWYHLPNEKGWYKEAGLDVQIEDGTGSTATTLLVGNGNFAIGGNIGLSAVASGRAKGVPVKAVAAIIQKSDLGFVYPKSSGWKSIKDFVDAGAEILVTPETIHTSLMPALFKIGGADMSKAKLVNVGTPAKVSTYVAKTNSVMTTTLFGIPAVETTLPSLILLYEDAGLILPGFGLITNESVIKNRPDDLRKFVTITMKAVDYIYNNHEKEGVQAVIKARPDGKVVLADGVNLLKLYRPIVRDESIAGKPTGFMPLKK
ncbi:MAG: hypothetical protein EXQ91_09365 [Alphaproteobacteria bacterium]|nr:hypothetical protein [Alphaproteobacteria bacterium]